jgi:hypothetical protein
VPFLLPGGKFTAEDTEEHREELDGGVRREDRGLQEERGKVREYK